MDYSIAYNAPSILPKENRFVALQSRYEVFAMRSLARSILFLLPIACLNAQTAPKPVATAKQLMEMMLIPASEALFDVGSKEPKTDAEWAAVKTQAILLAEGGHLLLIPGRGKPGVWNRNARLLVAAGAASLKAAEAKNIDKVIEAGDLILASCEGCHKQYLPKK